MPSSSKLTRHADLCVNIVTLSEEESTDLKEQLMKEKRRYELKPNDHPEYKSRWKKFWSRKHKILGSDIHNVNLIPEWTKEWREFLDDEFQRKMMKVNSSVMSEGKAELVTLSGESDDDIKYQPPAITSNNTPSTSRVLPPETTRSQSASPPRSEVKLERVSYDRLILKYKYCIWIGQQSK